MLSKHFFKNKKIKNHLLEYTNKRSLCLLSAQLVKFLMDLLDFLELEVLFVCFNYLFIIIIIIIIIMKTNSLSTVNVNL
jgi:hypothetical protein